MPYRSYHDFYSCGPNGQRLLQDAVVGSTTARLLYVSQPPGEFTDPAVPEFALFVGLRKPRRMSFRCGSGYWKGVWRPDDLAIARPYSATDVHVADAHEFLALTMPAPLVESALDDLIPGRPVSFGRLHASAFRDATVARYCKELWRHAIGSEGVPDRLSMDGLLLATIATLARRAHNHVTEVGSRLDGHALARVLDFVEDRLADKFSLAELAEVADLSAMHFARQFKRATGLSPHQYVLRCRIARAKAFLKLSPHPLAHIAQAVGFSSQSHMTTVFSRNVGFTPLRYRELLRA
jgi:AraC family transcriptional regulator